MTSRIKKFQTTVLTIIAFSFFGQISAQSNQENTGDNKVEQDSTLNNSAKPNLQESNDLKSKSDKKKIHVTGNYSSMSVQAETRYGKKRIAMAGVVNVSKDTLRGMQLAGVGNVTEGNVSGTQMAGVFNINNGNLEGLQIAGVSNIVTDSIEGTQLAGISNIVSYSKGFQGAGISNKVRDVHGVQLAGCVNIAENEVDGVQLSTYFNYAKKLNGLQLAYINISDTVESGVPIGFFSYVKKGFHQVELSYSSPLMGNVAFKTGTHKFYNIFIAGYSHHDDTPMWSYGYGLGTQINFGKRFYSNVELSAQHFQEFDFWIEDFNLLSTLNLNLGFNFSQRVSINAGPVLNVLFTDVYNNEQNTIGDLENIDVLYQETNDGTKVQMWVGYRAGIRF